MFLQSKRLGLMVIQCFNTDELFLSELTVERGQKEEGEVVGGFVAPHISPRRSLQRLRKGETRRVQTMGDVVVRRAEVFEGTSHWEMAR